MRPVVAVEPLAHLRTHVAEEEGVVHRILAELGVGGGDLVPAVVAAAGVIFELRAEELGDGLVFNEGGVLAVAAADLEGFSGDVLGDPVRVAGAAVVGGDEGMARCAVVDGAGEA